MTGAPPIPAEALAHHVGSFGFVETRTGEVRAAPWLFLQRGK